jgi:hypothetical protein
MADVALFRVGADVGVRKVGVELFKVATNGHQHTDHVHIKHDTLSASHVILIHSVIRLPTTHMLVGIRQKAL